MNGTTIEWFYDGKTATVQTNDPRIIGQLEALAEKDPDAAYLVYRYQHEGCGEDWTVKKKYINIIEV